MVRDIRWSKWIRRDLEHIQRFWDEQNGSPRFSDRLTFETIEMARLLAHHPFIGGKTAVADVYQKLVAEDYLLIYRVNAREIFMLRFWDTRQNPRKLKKYLS